jgi:hypothetical protein
VADASGVDRLCEELFLSPRARERDDNVVFVRDRLLRSDADRASLPDLYRQVRDGKRVPVDDTNPLVELPRLSRIARVAGVQADGHTRALGFDGVLRRFLNACRLPSTRVEEDAHAGTPCPIREL